MVLFCPHSVSLFGRINLQLYISLIKQLRGRIGQINKSTSVPVDPSLELPDDLHLPCEPKSVDSVLLVDGCQKNAAITVSRKENWAKFTWSCQEDSHNRRPCQSFSPVPQAPADIGFVATGPNKDTELLASYPETCNPSLNTKYSNQGAYLQTLEKSSRQWVLSTGKTQGVEEGASTSATEMKEFHKHGNSQGEIWYNPIPEDEDLQLPSLERKCGSSCENRDKKNNPIEVKVPHECIDIDSSLKTVNNVQISPIQLKRVKQVEMLGSHQSETYGELVLSRDSHFFRSTRTALWFGELKFEDCGE